eukprot:5909070-Prymnesium_polylepis.1
MPRHEPLEVGEQALECAGPLLLLVELQPHRVAAHQVLVDGVRWLCAHARARPAARKRQQLLRASEHHHQPAVEAATAEEAPELRDGRAVELVRRPRVVEAAHLRSTPRVAGARRWLGTAHNHSKHKGFGTGRSGVTS